MTVIYSNKEIELFNRLGCDWYSQAEPPVVYSTLCINVFLENRNDEDADSLRRCMKALQTDGPPFRLTKEFDDLIVLKEQEEELRQNPLHFISKCCGFNNLTIRQRNLIVNYDVNRFSQYSELSIPQARKIILCYLLHKIIFTENCNTAILTKKLDVIESILTIFEQLPKWLQPKIIRKTDNKIEFENGSLIYVSTNTNLFKGRNYDITIIDNVDYTENKNFMASVFPTITSSKNQKLFICQD